MQGFDECVVQHIKWEGNEAAHAVAKHDLSASEDMHWVE